ncbi:unnamed protein product [Auanema sp. JU1783]|nr:unnamed protein product [Auanema sp. JU1783]
MEKLKGRVSQRNTVEGGDTWTLDVAAEYDLGQVAELGTLGGRDRKDERYNDVYEMHRLQKSVCRKPRLRISAAYLPMSLPLSVFWPCPDQCCRSVLFGAPDRILKMVH